MCDCLEKNNNVLQEKFEGFRINTFISMTGGPSTPIISTDYFGLGKKPRGVRAPNLVPNYCPFCGEQYEVPQNER